MQKMAAATSTRPYQVVVWGASGFTGRLVCEHIAKDYQAKGLRWAVAGRSAEKLEQIKRDLGIESVPSVIADADDSSSLSRLASETDVIIATAGPFAKYGSKVVAAAVEQGTHYCDITGELVWVRRMIQQYHDTAAAKGVKIVHCCGYDSIPFDMGVLLLADHARKQLGKGLSQAYGLSIDARGGFSGGTLASGFNQIESEDSAEVSQLSHDKYFLLPKDARRGSDTAPGILPQWNPVAKKWMAPFVMEVINSRIVQRSSYLNGYYGSDFKYREAQATNGLVGASLVSSMMVGIGAMFALGPARNFAKRLLPKPGQGPSRDVMLNGYWKHTMIGLTEEKDGQEPQVIKAYVADEHRDPGYWGTARMLLEAGLCLAMDGAACEAAGCQKGGVLTPASAMGMVLIDRLRKAGLKFDITESPALSRQQQLSSSTAEMAAARK
eukprot:GHUV01002224.1.p1 GENE.GHUV01002224.1~~GHUV01002224.1.p1  ORF type:complete len:439 (+),score=107.02 GHUV01002224.1:127-1443(+)